MRREDWYPILGDHPAQGVSNVPIADPQPPKAPYPDNYKPSNPKDSVGIKKAYSTVIPMNVELETGVALFEGARKYGRHNYREVGVRASVYVDAARRHLAAFWEGEDVDPDSGLSHITKAIAGLVVLRDSMMRGNWEDDRPPPAPEGWMKRLNELTEELIEKYPDAKPPILAEDLL